jgi:hypothetical protein
MRSIISNPVISFQVDGDRKNLLPPGQDSVSAVAAHAALLSAANAGTGYSAFA